VFIVSHYYLYTDGIKSMLLSLWLGRLVKRERIVTMLCIETSPDNPKGE
jgi:hypothetical protein